MCWKKMYLSTVGRLLPTDVFSERFPVSVKGVCLCEGKVVMVKNEHGQWDLPGGKLRNQEELVACLERELREELGVKVGLAEKVYFKNKLLIDNRIHSKYIT